LACNVTSTITPNTRYRGRLAPSPTGHLHLGHARTFWIAQVRAKAASGTLVLRNEDLDENRARPEFVSSMLEDLHWFGLRWQEGPDVGGPSGPYNQSERRPFHFAAWKKLLDGGFIYPCKCSRRDIQQSLQAPHQGEEEPVYPGTCRPPENSRAFAAISPAGVNWRFRVPDGETISFHDGHFGLQQFLAGKDFGDFIVWRHDDAPSYQLAVVADDAAMKITEVVRGQDLLLSTARQILLYQALGLKPPAFYHCPLMTDDSGARLAKRHDALSLRTLRAGGNIPESLRAGWITPPLV
jgi:glutamyl-tRNA synthetase